MQVDPNAVVVATLIFILLMLFVISPIKFNYIRKELSDHCTSCDPAAIPQIGNLWMVGDILTVGFSVIFTIGFMQYKHMQSKASEKN
jgi:hypothetical protein